jgi:hypothetical protein
MKTSLALALATLTLLAILTGSTTQAVPVTCAANNYVTFGACTPCIAGASRPAGDPVSGGDTTCAHTICREDERVHTHRCVGCRGDDTSVAGFDATGSNTLCESTGIGAGLFIVLFMFIVGILVVTCYCCGAHTKPSESNSTNSGDDCGDVCCAGVSVCICCGMN